MQSCQGLKRKPLPLTSRIVNIIVKASSNRIAKTAWFIDVNESGRVHGAGLIPNSHRVQTLIVLGGIVDRQNVNVRMIKLNLRAHKIIIYNV